MTNLNALRIHAGSCAAHVRELLRSAISEIESLRAQVVAKDGELSTLKTELETLKAAAVTPPPPSPDPKKKEEAAA